MNRMERLRPLLDLCREDAPLLIVLCKLLPQFFQFGTHRSRPLNGDHEVALRFGERLAKSLGEKPQLSLGIFAHGS